MPEAIRDVFVKCCHWRALKRTDGGRELAGGGSGGGGGGGGGGGRRGNPLFHPPTSPAVSTLLNWEKQQWLLASFLTIKGSSFRSVAMATQSPRGP